MESNADYNTQRVLRPRLKQGTQLEGLVLTINSYQAPSDRRVRHGGPDRVTRCELFAYHTDRRVLQGLDEQ